MEQLNRGEFISVVGLDPQCMYAKKSYEVYLPMAVPNTFGTAREVKAESLETAGNMTKFKSTKLQSRPKPV